MFSALVKKICQPRLPRLGAQLKTERKAFQFSFSSLSEGKPQSNQEIMQFKFLINYFNRFSSTQSRLVILAELRELLDCYIEFSDKELFLNMLKLLTCNISTASSGRELMTSDALFTSSLSTHFHKPQQQVIRDLSSFGDFGELASAYYLEESKSSSKPGVEKGGFEINTLIQRLKLIGDTIGEGSKELKEALLVELLRECSSAEEMKFIIRIIQKGLRVGVTDKSVVKALGQIQEKKNITDIIKDVEQKVLGFYTGLIEKENNSIKVGLPLKPMLGKALAKVEEATKTFQKFGGNILCEYKYDGERTQVHFEKGSVDLFSRNLEKQNAKYPLFLSSLTNYLKANPHIESCILDCEIIAYSPETGKILPFQSLQKKEESEAQQRREQRILLFDILYLNGTSFLDLPLEKRKEIIQLNFPDSHVIEKVAGTPINLNEEFSIDKLSSLLKESVASGLEGLFLKALGDKTHYDSNSRVQWAKVKSFILDSNICDSLDLVPIAAYWGKGKRKGVYGAYLMAAFNAKQKSFDSICKLGTGFSDEFLEASSNSFKGKELPKCPTNYSVNLKVLKPDVWLQSCQVWELAADQFTLSPLYSIGKKMVDEEKGLSLRFPRFIRIREDKGVEDSTSTEQLVELYLKSVQNTKGS